MPSSSETSPAVSTVGFGDLGLNEVTLDRLAELGFEVPTPIQIAAIPSLLDGRDVVGIAQTGTGKTAAFGLPLVEMIAPEVREVQALVLAPTRELALQTAQAIEQLGANTSIEVIAVYGGSPYGPQLRALRGGAQVVVGTPGRMIDLIEKGALHLNAVRMLVLDEADEMLRMGFAEDVETITSSLPTERLTALFSATMPSAIERVAASHLTDPVRLEVSSQSSTVDTIRQTYAVIPTRYRFEALTRVLATRSGGATIVFVKTRQEAEEVSLDLAAAGFKAAGISGDVAQHDRERLVTRLREGTLDVLVATDVAARGLDVERIELVVNYDVPREREAYVHRVGRTGRAGRDGESLTFFGPKERFRLGQIERLTGNRMEEVQVPSHSEVVRFLATRKLETLAPQAFDSSAEVLEQALDAALESGEDLRDLTLRLLASVTDLSIADTSKRGSFIPGETDREGRFLGAEFTGPGKKGKRGDRGDRGVDRGIRSERGGRADTAGRPARRRPIEAGFEHRYRVEVGRRDGVNPGSIVGAITGEGGLRGDSLGKINIFPSFSLVELSERLSPSQVKKIGAASIRGRRLRIAEDAGQAPRARAGKKYAGRSKD